MSLPVEKQPATLHPVPSRFRHTVHSYTGIDPWDRAGGRLLYMAFDDDSARAQIVIQDLASGQETVLGETTVNNVHDCAGQKWVLDDRAILYAAAPGEWMRADTEPPHRVRPVPALRGKFCRQVPGHGAVATAATCKDHPPARGIELVNLETGAIRPVLTVAQALKFLPEELKKAGVAYHFNHPVLSDDGSRMFCKLMQAPASPLGFCAFYTVHLPTGTVRCLGNRISGHPIWTADNRQILNIKTERPATGDPACDEKNNMRHLVLVDADTGADRVLLEVDILGPGHPSMAPQGRYLVTDTFPPPGETSPLLLADLETQTVREIACLPHRFVGGKQLSAMTRAQPHPAWSGCGTRLLVNCNHDGQRLGLQVVSDFL